MKAFFLAAALVFAGTPAFADNATVTIKNFMFAMDVTVTPRLNGHLEKP